MTATTPAPAAARVPTAGAWLGLGIAARAALSVGSAAATFATAAAIEVFVDAATSFVRADERSPQVDRLLDVWLEGAAVLGPYARIAGGSGVLVGVALFVAAALLVRGHETARRATRGLLVLEALHALASGAWMVVLCCTTLAEWNHRYQGVLAEVIDTAGAGAGRMPAWVEAGERLNAAFYGGWAVASAAMVVALAWLAGRPFVRDWCAARSVTSPIDPPAGRR